MRLTPKLSVAATILLVATASVVVLVVLREQSREPSAWPAVLTPEQSRRALRTSCERAKGEDRLLLVEFSAPWCEHCQGAAGHKRKPEVAAALESFESLLINIGEGHALDDLRRELGARAIPYWTVVEPSRCAEPMSSWPRKASVFPTGNAEELAGWLRANAS